MMISTSASTTGIHSGLHTHHQLHAISLQSFNTKNTTNSTPKMPIPPDDFSFIYAIYFYKDPHPPCGLVPLKEGQCLPDG